MSDEEKRKAIEKEKSARQSEQGKDLEKVRLANEASVIAEVSTFCLHRLRHFKVREFNTSYAFY